MATALRRAGIERTFWVRTIADQVLQGQRTLAALNLDGLGRIEALGGALVAAIGIAVLGAFLILERRREFAILQTIGADTTQVLTGPVQEGISAVVGSIVVGVPLGLGLGILAVRVLGLFFTLPPPLLTVPLLTLAGFMVVVLGASAIALSAALVAVTRVDAATVLREP